MHLPETMGENWPRPCNVPKMFPLVSGYPCPQWMLSFLIFFLSFMSWISIVICLIWSTKLSGGPNSTPWAAAGECLLKMAVSTSHVVVGIFLIVHSSIDHINITLPFSLIMCCNRLWAQRTVATLSVSSVCLSLCLLGPCRPPICLWPIYPPLQLWVCFLYVFLPISGGENFHLEDFTLFTSFTSFILFLPYCLDLPRPPPDSLHHPHSNLALPGSVFAIKKIFTLHFSHFSFSPPFPLASPAAKTS